MFSLIKTIFEICLSVYMVSSNNQKVNRIKEQLNGYDNKLIKEGTQVYVLLRKLIMLRRKIIFYKISVFIYSMRMIMLYYSIKLHGYTWLDPIFVSICGLIQAIFVVFKAMKGSK